MVRLPIDVQQEPTAGSMGLARGTISPKSPKGAGEEEEAEGWGEDFDEDEDARLRESLGTVSDGVSHVVEEPGGEVVMRGL